jgi:hypothetical protein
LVVTILIVFWHDSHIYNSPKQIPTAEATNFMLDFSGKLAFLHYLINCLYDCKPFHLAIANCLEDKAWLSKEKNDNIVKIRTKEAKLKAG